MLYVLSEVNKYIQGTITRSDDTFQQELIMIMLVLISKNISHCTDKTSLLSTMYFSTRASTYLSILFQTFPRTLLVILLMVHDFSTLLVILLIFQTFLVIFPTFQTFDTFLYTFPLEMIQAFGDIFKNTILQHQWLF